MHDRFDESLRMTLLNRLDDVDVAAAESDAGAGLGEIHHRQSDEERQRRNDLEINYRLDSHPPDLLRARRRRRFRPRSWKRPAAR